MTAPTPLPMPNLGPCNPQDGQIKIPITDDSPAAVERLAVSATIDQISEPVGICSEGENSFILVDDYSRQNPSQTERLRLINEIVTTQLRNANAQRDIDDMGAVANDLKRLKEEVEKNPESDLLKGLMAAVLGWGSVVAIFGYGTHGASDLAWLYEQRRGLGKTNRFRLRVQGELTRLKIKGQCTENSPDLSRTTRALETAGRIFRLLEQIINRKIALAVGTGLAVAAAPKLFAPTVGKPAEKNADSKKAMQEMAALQTQAEEALMSLPSAELEKKYEEVTRQGIKLSAGADAARMNQAGMKQELAALQAKQKDSTWLWGLAGAGSTLGTIHAFGIETDRAREILDQFRWHRNLQSQNGLQQELAREQAVQEFSALAQAGKLNCRKMPREVEAYRTRVELERIAAEEGARESAPPVAGEQPEPTGYADGYRNYYMEEGARLDEPKPEAERPIWPWVVGGAAVLGIGAAIYFSGGAAIPILAVGGEAGAGAAVAGGAAVTATTSTGVTLTLVQGGLATAAVAETGLGAVAVGTVAGTAGLAKAAGVLITVGGASLLASSEARAESSEPSEPLESSGFYDAETGKCVAP